MVELTYLSLKKTTFFVRIFDISHCVFTQISIGRARWMWNLIPHPTSTHTAYFWQTPLPQKQEIPGKQNVMMMSFIITFFSSIYCFLGRRVRKKYALWVCIGCGIKFCIQWALPLRIWVKKTRRYAKNTNTKSSFFHSSSKINNYYFIIFLRRPILDPKFPLMLVGRILLPFGIGK